MSEKTYRTALKICLNIVLFGSVMLLTYALAPVHELFHFIPCKLAGLSPTDVSYSKVSCPGIGEKPYLTQFFYFMGPYLVHSSILVFSYIFAERNLLIKYLALIPAFDTAFNFLTSRKGSDFSFFLKNIYPKESFHMGLILLLSLVIFNLSLTVQMIVKYRIWSFQEIIDKYLLPEEK